jgi:hypothetical protein
VEKARCNKEKEMSKNVLLISAEMIKDRTAVHTNIDEKLVFPTIKVCQDMYIHPLLGTALFNKIINEVDAATIAGDYKNLLDDYIIDCLCWYVLSKMALDISYQFWNKGVVRKQGDSTELPDQSELEAIRNEYRMRAEWYGQRLKNYLLTNATTVLFPEYLTNTACDAILPQQDAFTMPVYLGDEYDCMCKDKHNPPYQP